MTGIARLGGPIACLGLALLLTGKTRRDRLAGLGFATIGACVLAAALAPDRPLELVGGTAAVLVVGGALALAFRRVPWLFPVLALACMPIRVGALGHQLLVPLYVVVLGAALALAWELARGELRVREFGRATVPLAFVVAWTGLSLAWTKDVHEGAIEVLAFYVPFVVLALAVARLPWNELGPRALHAEVAVMGLIFAAVGFYQYDTRNIFENRKVIHSNAYAPFFRVNSLFWDPSVYGRFLVLAMIPSIVLIVRGRSTRLAWAAFAALIVTWLGLLISFSQSSFAALLVAVFGVAILVWRWRALIAVVLAAIVLAGLAVAQPQVRRSLQHHTVHGLNSATSGRADLVANGVRIAVAHPALGVGVGGFRRAYVQRRHLKGLVAKKVASHDTPVTVAAETGVIGLALFVWLLVALFRDGFRRVDRSLRGRTSLVAALGLAAILCHSLFYADFFEDPMTWALFGLVALVAPRRERVAQPAPPPAEREAVPV